MIAVLILSLLFEFFDNNPFFLWILPLLLFLPLICSTAAKQAKRARAEREREARRLAEAERKKAAAEERKRRAEEKASAEAAEPKRPRGRPRKNPPPVDPPAQRPEIISAVPRKLSELEKVAFENLYSPEDFIKQISA